jgi:hypothetical protein
VANFVAVRCHLVTVYPLARRLKARALGLFCSAWRLKSRALLHQRHSPTLSPPRHPVTPSPRHPVTLSPNHSATVGNTSAEGRLAS